MRMGRRKSPLNGDAPYPEIARTLRSLREQAGLTYRTMAQRIADPGCSAATLSRADSGDILPRKSVVVAYGMACGASREAMVGEWTKAAGRTRRRQSIERRGPDRPPPRIDSRQRLVELIWEPMHLLRAMHHLRRLAGDPSLRELQRRARRMGLPALPKSTVAEVLSGVRLPTEQQFMTYVVCCGVAEPDVQRWLSAYRRTVGVRRLNAG